MRWQRATRRFFGRPNFGNRSSPRKTGGAKNDKKLPASARGQLQENFRADVDSFAPLETRK
jgi:hypothetical protein